MSLKSVIMSPHGKASESESESALSARRRAVIFSLLDLRASVCYIFFDLTVGDRNDESEKDDTAPDEDEIAPSDSLHGTGEHLVCHRSCHIADEIEEARSG